MQKIIAGKSNDITRLLIINNIHYRLSWLIKIKTTAKNYDIDKILNNKKFQVFVLTENFKIKVCYHYS